MAYGTKVDKIKEEAPLKIGIHEVVLKSIVFEMTSPKDVTKQPQEIMKLRFESLEGNYFEHTVYNPENGKDPLKIDASQEYLSNLITYVSAAVYGKERIDESTHLPDTISSWEELSKYTLEKIFEEDFSENMVYLKLIGDVYKNKPSIKITRYFGWLKNLEKVKEGVAKLPEFSDGEKKSSNEYIRAISNPAVEGSATTQDTTSEIPDPNAVNNDLPF